MNLIKFFLAGICVGCITTGCASGPGVSGTTTAKTPTTPSTAKGDWTLNDGQEYLHIGDKAIPTSDPQMRTRFNAASALAKRYLDVHGLDWGEVEIAIARDKDFAIIYFKALNPAGKDGARGVFHQLNVSFDGVVTLTDGPEM
jgi:hypothetical protein